MENLKLLFLIRKSNISKWAAKLILGFVVQLLTLPIVCSQDITQVDRSVVPPSPTAYELGKYGYFPVSLFTGSASYSIPLYELKGKNLSIPISLSYYSNGIKVDQVATCVGMGWSLNAGGAITHIVRGSDDDLDGSITIGLQDSLTTLSKFNQSDYVRNHVDSEPDLYAYNFSGHSGKFVIDKTNNNIYTIPFENIKIVYTKPLKFDITTEEGIVYSFGVREWSRQTSSCSQVSFKNDYKGIVNTAYFLSKIKHPAGDSINLSYIGDTLTYNAGLEQTVRNLVPTPYNPLPNLFSPCVIPNDQLNCQYNNGQNTPCQKQYSICSYILAGISYGNITLQFNSSKIRSDIPNSHRMENFVITNNYTGETLKSYGFNYNFSTDNSRMFLTNVIEKGADLSQGNSYTFSYNNINSLPPRLSMAQDHWGYYNGATSNSGIIPITRDDSLGFAQATNNQSGGVTLKYLFSFLNNTDREPHDPYSQMGMLTQIAYPTGGTTKIDYEANSYYYNSTNIAVGGLRVMRVTTQESASSPAQVERYYYSNDLNNLTKSSANVPKKPRYYYIYTISTPVTWNTSPYCCCPATYLSCTNVNLTSSSLNNIYQCSGNYIVYPWVVKGLGNNFENGGEHYQYLNTIDSNGNSVLFSDSLTHPLHPYYIRPATDALDLTQKSNYSWNAGALLYKKSFTKNTSGQFVTLREETFTYNQDLNNSKNITGYSIRKYSDEITTTGYKYQQIYGYDVVKYLTFSRWGYLKSKTITQYDTNGLNPVLSTTNYIYANPTHAQLTQEQTTDSKGNTIQKKIYYPSDYNSSSFNFGILNTVHIVNIPVDIRKYVNTKLAEGQQIKYNNFGQPTDIYSAETNGTDVTFVPTNAYTFTHKSTYLYDATANINNLNQVTKDYNVPTTYLWSYNNSLPVAKIENATFSQVSSSLTPLFITALGTTNSQSSINSQLSQLRGTLALGIPGARTSTYTYSQLNGMTSQTDPNGVTTSYEYDPFGRLKNVRDKDQYFLARNYYHYYSDFSTDAATLNVSINSANIAYTAYSSSFAITANCPWTASSNAAWLTVNPLSGNFSGSVAVNATVNPGSSRTGTITINYGNGQTKTVSYLQYPNGSTLSTNINYIAAGRYSANYNVVVSSNTSWTATKSQSWLTVTPSSGTGNVTIAISPQAWLLGTRTATVTLTTNDGAVSVVITVFQDASILN